MFFLYFVHVQLSITVDVNYTLLDVRWYVIYFTQHILMQTLINLVSFYHICRSWIHNLPNVWRNIWTYIVLKAIVNKSYSCSRLMQLKELNELKTKSLPLIHFQNCRYDVYTVVKIINRPYSKENSINFLFFIPFS